MGLHHSTSGVNLAMNGATWSIHAWPVSGTPCQVWGGTEKETAISMPPAARAAALASAIFAWICAR